MSALTDTFVSLAIKNHNMDKELDSEHVFRRGSDGLSEKPQ